MFHTGCVWVVNAARTPANKFPERERERAAADHRDTFTHLQLQWEELKGVPWGYAQLNKGATHTLTHTHTHTACTHSYLHSVQAFTHTHTHTQTHRKITRTWTSPHNAEDDGQSSETRAEMLLPILISNLSFKPFIMKICQTFPCSSFVIWGYADFLSFLSL